MWRHRACCSHCDSASRWERDREKSLREIISHLGEIHKVADPWEALDYRVIQERQCDYCLGSYVDHCTKCDRDFCRRHEGDIDGLCGGCI
jgi:hypothetical protein